MIQNFRTMFDLNNYINLKNFIFSRNVTLKFRIKKSKIYLVNQQISCFNMQKYKKRPSNRPLVYLFNTNLSNAEMQYFYTILSSFYILKNKTTLKDS